MSRRRKLLLDPLPDGGDLLAEFLVVFPEIDEGRRQHSDHSCYGDRRRADRCDRGSELAAGTHAALHLIDKGQNALAGIGDRCEKTADAAGQLAHNEKYGPDRRGHGGDTDDGVSL